MIERAQEEDRAKALARSQRRQKLGVDFEKAVEEAEGSIRLCNMLFAELVEKENNVRDQYYGDQYLGRNRTRELKKIRAETEEALRKSISS